MINELDDIEELLRATKRSDELVKEGRYEEAEALLDKFRRPIPQSKGVVVKVPKISVPYIQPWGRQLKCLVN